MKLITRIIIAGLLVAGLSFAKHRDGRWSREDRASYRWNDRYSDNYHYRGNYVYPRYGYNGYYNNLPPGLAKRRGNLPPGIERKLRRQERQRWEQRWWRGW